MAMADFHCVILAFFIVNVIKECINRVLNFADIYFHALGSTDIKGGAILSSPSNNLPNQASLLRLLYFFEKYSYLIFFIL